MSLHPHTILMNYVIGLCKRTQTWVSPLADLSYDVQLIEQRIRTSGGYEIKPDIIKVSNKSLHALVIECKTASNNPEQMSRYSTLTEDDLRRWATVYSNDQLKFDICIVDFESNHSNVAETTKFPILTFGDEQLTKTNDFSVGTLNDVFANAISIKGMNPPLSYYPFSENDSDVVITPRILRELVSMVLSRARGGASVLNEAIFETDEVLSRIHPLWKAISSEHKTSLRDRIRTIVTRLRGSDPKLREQLDEMQRGGYKVRGPPASFTDICNGIIEKTQKQMTLDSLPKDT